MTVEVGCQQGPGDLGSMWLIEIGRRWLVVVGRDQVEVLGELKLGAAVRCGEELLQLSQPLPRFLEPLAVRLVQS